MLLRGVFSAAEIGAVADEADRLIARHDLIDADNIRCRWQNHVESGDCLFECFDPVIDIGPACERLARDPRILSPLAELYGEPAQLFKDKLIFKPPGARGYNLHQDFIGWKDFPHSFVTVLVVIDAASQDNGATEVFPACHRQGYLSPHDGMYHELTPGGRGGRCMRAVWCSTWNRATSRSSAASRRIDREISGIGSRAGRRQLYF